MHPETSHSRVEAPPSEETSTGDRLREAAMELFAARGYSGTSMADIARRVGIRKASLYNYYDAKEELLLDLLRRALEAWRAHSRPVLKQPGSRRRRLRSHLAAAVSFVAEHPHEIAVVRLAAIQIGGKLGERVKELLAEQDVEESAYMERFFAAAMKDGEIAVGDPGTVTLVWRCFLDGLLLNLILAPPGPNRFEERQSQLWELFWRSLAGRESTAPEGAP